jgi:RNA polymerase primary sigma factor
MRLREVLDRDPTDEEVASELGLDAKRVRRYRQASRAPVSLDAPIGDDDNDRVSEVVADPNAALPSEQLAYASDTALAQEILATLPEREREILAMRFGLNDGKERTLEEVGERFGVTRERIRQIQEQALKTIRKTMEKRDQRADDIEPFAVAA